MSDLFILDQHSSSCYSVWTYPSKQKYLGDILFDISCGWVYYIDSDSGGWLSAQFLRAVADKLDELNAELFKEMPATQGHSRC